jgi:hypothetical protein
MPSWLVLFVKIAVLVVSYFAGFKTGAMREEARSRPLREAIERMREGHCGAHCRCGKAAP